MARKYKKLRTASDLNKLMTRYYTKSKIISKLKPMAWVTSGAPIEILVAMGIASVYPENYGALCGARRVATSLCQVAEAQGYSQDLCSYARSHIGSVLDRREAPLGGLPKPDLLVACNNICGTALKWYQALAQYYHVPLFVLDTPFIHGSQMEEHAVQYVAAQLEEFIAWLEEHTGRKLKQKRLMETLELSNRAVGLWGEIRELCQARPSPLNAPDLFVNMAPIWCRLYRFFGYFVDFGACFVVDTYTNGWSTSLELSEPIEGLARTYTSVYINQSLQARAEIMVDLAERFQVDGIVFHSNRSCKPYSLGQYGLRRIVSERTGKPGLILEADMCDTRAYAEEPLKTRIQAFMETLAAQRF